LICETAVERKISPKKTMEGPRKDIAHPWYFEMASSPSKSYSSLNVIFIPSSK
jgi:hypothetical protein